MPTHVPLPGWCHKGQNLELLTRAAHGVVAYLVGHLTLNTGCRVRAPVGTSGLRLGREEKDIYKK